MPKPEMPYYKACKFPLNEYIKGLPYRRFCCQKLFILIQTVLHDACARITTFKTCINSSLPTPSNFPILYYN